jgi:hypothetical protein
MNNDYLWDRTGEPDAGVKELEEVLSTLRYQPKPFVLPDDVKMASKQRRWFPFAAIAASIALAVLMLGIWLSVQRKNAKQPVIAGTDKTGAMAKTTPPTPLPSVGPEALREPAVGGIEQPPQYRLVRRLNRPRTRPMREELSAAKRAEAEAAKEQLMLALRVVSAKLNLAQRKTVVPGTNNQRYQHKVG